MYVDRHLNAHVNVCEYMYGKKGGEEKKKYIQYVCMKSCMKKKKKR